MVQSVVDQNIHSYVSQKAHQCKPAACVHKANVHLCVCLSASRLRCCEIYRTLFNLFTCIFKAFFLQIIILSLKWYELRSASCILLTYFSRKHQPVKRVVFSHHPTDQSDVIRIIISRWRLHLSHSGRMTLFYFTVNMFKGIIDYSATDVCVCVCVAVHVMFKLITLTLLTLAYINVLLTLVG